jgi:peptidyl-prolyl cis-trans isomerase C
LRAPAISIGVLLANALLTACGSDRPAALPSGAAALGEVLATVNGAPITRLDVEQRLRKASAAGGGLHDAEGARSASLAANALDVIVRDELLLQEAERLKLDEDPEYRVKLADLQAQLRAFQRKELSGLYQRRLQQAASVSDAEAAAWFERNAGSARTKFHVQQILYKGDAAAIERAKQELDAGAPFEEVAARRFPVVPKGARPWDLGPLSLSQFPPPWRGIVDRLEPGQVSGVIRGDGDRAWVVRLVGRSVDPAVTFQGERARIVERLRQERAEALVAGALEELKGKARIVYAK